MFSSLFTVLALLSLSLTTTAQETNCSAFNWNHQSPNITYALPTRISAAKSCPADMNQTCLITASGDQSYAGGWNLTDIGSWNMDLIESAVNESVGSDTLVAPTFNITVTGSIDGRGTLEPGQAGYLNITVFYFCYEGTVGDCEGNVQNGTVVKVCGPVWHYEGDEVKMDGEYSIQNVSADDVDQYDDPYENQVSDEDVGLGLLERMNLGLAVMVGLVVVMVV
ncbi:hypothetical protein BDV18DRAFT_161403 [Aspergillus unguis]